MNRTYLINEKEKEEIREYLGYYRSYIENRGYHDMSGSDYEKTMSDLDRLCDFLDIDILDAFVEEISEG